MLIFAPCSLSLILRRRFNIYIWDYCQKRGYLGTAQKLVEEAKLPPTPRPPIDAKQGLLYECAYSLIFTLRDLVLTAYQCRWWSVFWVLFSAKNSGSGSEDAMVVVQVSIKPSPFQLPNGPPSYSLLPLNDTAPLIACAERRPSSSTSRDALPTKCCPSRSSGNGSNATSKRTWRSSSTGAAGHATDGSSRSSTNRALDSAHA